MMTDEKNRNEGIECKPEMKTCKEDDDKWKAPEIKKNYEWDEDTKKKQDMMTTKMITNEWHHIWVELKQYKYGHTNLDNKHV